MTGCRAQARDRIHKRDDVYPLRLGKVQYRIAILSRVRPLGLKTTSQGIQNLKEHVQQPQKRLSFDVCTCSWTVYVAHGGNISSRSILSRTATWTVQEQGSSSNLNGFLGSWARSLRWCIHFDAVLSPRPYGS